MQETAQYVAMSFDPSQRRSVCVTQLCHSVDLSTYLPTSHLVLSSEIRKAAATEVCRLSFRVKFRCVLFT